MNAFQMLSLLWDSPKRRRGDKEVTQEARKGSRGQDVESEAQVLRVPDLLCSTLKVLLVSTGKAAKGGRSGWAFSGKAVENSSRPGVPRIPLMACF